MRCVVEKKVWSPVDALRAVTALVGLAVLHHIGHFHCWLVGDTAVSVVERKLTKSWTKSARAGEELKHPSWHRDSVVSNVGSVTYLEDLNIALPSHLGALLFVRAFPTVDHG